MEADLNNEIIIELDESNVISDTLAGLSHPGIHPIFFTFNTERCFNGVERSAEEGGRKNAGGRVGGVREGVTINLNRQYLFCFSPSFALLNLFCFSKIV